MTYTIGTATTNGSFWSCDVLRDKRLFCSVINVANEEEAIRRVKNIAATMNIFPDLAMETGDRDSLGNLGIVLRNDLTRRYHPAYCGPDLDSDGDGQETIPYRPFMVHLKGFDTIDEAVSDKARTCLRMGWDVKPWVMDWDGVSIPEDSFEVAFSRSRDQERLPGQDTAPAP